jgi:peptidoglycan/LPS O-acetylase OafA/YrhL
VTNCLEVKSDEMPSDVLSAWLDHVRWMSTFVVLLGHIRNFAFIPFKTIKDPTWFDWFFYAVTNLQNEAVICFFTISGYLVGRKLVLYISQGYVPIGSYIIDRLSRLYCVLLPTFILMLFTHTIGACNLNEFDGWIGNLFFAQDLFTKTTSCNETLWSLTNEFWYYFLGLLFTILWLNYNWVLLTLTLGIISMIALVDQVDNHHILFYFPMWAVGISLFWSNKLLPWAPPARICGLVFIAVLLISRSHLLDPLYVLVDFLLAAALCLFLVSVQGRQVSPLAPQTGKWLAGFSYSLYLVHWPITKILHHKTSGFQNLNSHEFLSFVIFFGVIIACTVCAYLMSLCTEYQTPRVRKILKRSIKILPLEEKNKGQ